MINIVSCFSRTYLQHFLVMAKSVEMNTPNTSIAFHVLYKNLEEADLMAIKKEFELHSYFHFHFYPIDFSQLNKLQLNLEYLSHETFSRLILSEVLPSDMNRMIYIDSDVVVRKNLNDLYYSDLEQYLFAAVPDMNPYFSDIFKTRTRNMNYFNAGVLLIDLNKWREVNFSSELMDFALSNAKELEYADQDVLNIVADDKWKQLDLEWNVNSNFFNFTDFQSLEVNKEQMRMAKSNPAIVHYTGASKPWFLFDEHPYKMEYIKYLKMLKFPTQYYKESKFLEHKNIILFGTSKKADEYYTRLTKHNITIKSFFDNNQSKWGETYKNLVINKPCIECYDATNDFILIASHYYVEISDQLSQWGLEKNKHFFEDINALAAHLNEM